jgi:hypothetical protein
VVVVQGGIGPAGLASEDLHVLDLQGTPRHGLTLVHCLAQRKHILLDTFGA